MIQFIIALLLSIPGLGSSTSVQASQAPIQKNVAITVPKKIVPPVVKQKPEIVKKKPITVPFFSQFTDITSPEWKKVGCGIASLAMIINYYEPDTVSVDALLKQGIKAGAYSDAGWTYKGLISLGEKYGLDGNSYDLGALSSKSAFSKFKTSLEDGPVIASVHYKFDPKSTIPHLVVINRIENETLYYNDPAAKTGEKTISSEAFLKAWKKRFIVIRA